MNIAVGDIYYKRTSYSHELLYISDAVSPFVFAFAVQKLDVDGRCRNLGNIQLSGIASGSKKLSQRKAIQMLFEVMSDKS